MRHKHYITPLCQPSASCFLHTTKIVDFTGASYHTAHIDPMQPGRSSTMPISIPLHMQSAVNIDINSGITVITVVLDCCKSDNPSQWETPILDRCSSKTPWPILMKFARPTSDHAVDPQHSTTQANVAFLGSNGARPVVVKLSPRVYFLFLSIWVY